MKLRSTLLFAAASLSAAALAPVTAVPAWAEDITLTNGERTALTISDGTTGAGNTYSYAAPTETDKGGWLWLGNLGYTNNVAFGTSASPMALSGSGIIAIGYQGGNGGVIYNFDFSNTDASAFSGKFAVVNAWDNNTVVKLSGTNWSNVEYVSGGVSREQSWATLRSYANASRAEDKLELQGATTLAGITGVSKGYSYGNVSDVNSKEFVTASTSGTVLTLSGTGAYSYYGSVGTSSVSIGLEKTGTGTQTFGGAAKYLSSVKVSAGTLALTEGTVTISGNATVASGAMLDLSGATVSLSSAISNSGTVTVNSSSVFVLAEALKNAGADTTYTLISGGMINGWNSSTLSISNFRQSDGSVFTGRSLVDVATTSGVVKITEVAAENLVWRGGESGTWDTTTQNWTNGTSANPDKFYSKDSVTFSTSGASVTLDEAITAGAVTVTEDTTITATETNTLTADSISVSAGTLTLTGQQYVSASSIDIADGATLALGNLENSVNVQHTLTGTGTVSISKTSGNHGHTINLGTEFAGTVDYTGRINPGNAVWGSNSAKVNFTDVYFWSNGGTATIAQKLNFSGTGNQIESGTLNLTGEISFSSDALFTVKGGTLSISGAVTGGNFTQSGGTLNVSGTGTTEISTYTFSGASSALNFSGTGTKTIGTLSPSGNDNNSRTISIAAGTPVSIGTLNNSWGIKTLTIDGELNVTGNMKYSSGGMTNTITGSGTLTAATFTAANVGTYVFSGALSTNITTLSATAATTTFSNTGTNTITTLSQTAGTLNFSGTGTTTIGSFTGPTAAGGGTNPITNVNTGATVNVSNDFVLRYQGNGTSTLNVAGTMSVGGALTLSRDGNGIVNINNGGTLIAGSLGFGQYWDGSGKSSVVNVNTGGTLIANGFTKANTHINSSSFNLSGGTFGTSADSVTLNVDGLPVVLVDGTTSTINTGKYNTTTKQFTGTGSSIAIANAISGSGALTVTGAGTLTLSGTNTFTGGVTISAGTLIATQDAALGDSDGTISLEENGTLELGADFGSSFSRTMSGAGTLATNADLSWTTSGTAFAGSFNVKSGTFTLTADAGSSFNKLSSSAGAMFKANQNIAFSSVESFAGTLSGASSSTRVSVAEGSFSGTWNTVSLVKTGTGTLDMNGATFATGGSLVVEGGTVSNLTLAGGGTLTFNTTAEASATMSNLTIYGGTTISITESFTDIATAVLTDTLTLTDISGGSKLTLEFSNIAVSLDYQVFTFTSDGKTAWEAAFGTLTEDGKFSGGNLTLAGIATDTSGKFAWVQNSDGTYTLQFRENRAAETFYWRGNGETPSWDEAANWTPKAFVPGSAAVFDKDSLVDGVATVVISSSVVANSVTVDLLTDASEGAKGELTISQWDAAATMLVHNGITVKTGVLNFVASSGSFYKNAFIIEKNGELNLGNGVADLALENKFSGEGVVRHNHLGRTLTLSGTRSEFTGTLDVQAGTVVLANTTGEENFEIALAKTDDAEGTVEISGGKTTSTGDVALALKKVSGAGTLSISGGTSLDNTTFYDLKITDGDSFTGTVKLTNVNIAVVDTDFGEWGTSVTKSTFGNASLIVVENSELNFTQKGGDDAVFSKNVEIGASGGKIRVYENNGDGATFAGNVSGAGALTITGSREAAGGAAGKITFTSESFEVGSLTVTGGDVAIDVNAMNIAGAVSLAGTATTLSATDGTIGGTLTANTTGTLTLGGSLNIKGDLVSEKNSAISISLSENANISVGGEMRLASADGLQNVIAGTGTDAGTLNLGSLTVGSGAEYLFQNLNIAITGKEDSGSVIGIANAGTIKLQDVVISAAGETSTGWTSASAFALNDGTTTFDVGEGKTITLSGAIAEAVATATGEEGDADYVAATSSVLKKTGAGTLKLTQANTNAGGTTVSEGTLEYALSDGTAFAQNVTVDKAGTLRFAASTTTTAGTTTVGGTVNVGSELNFTAGSTLTAATGTKINIAENGSLTGAITFSSEGTSSTRGNLTFATDSTIAEGDSLTLNDGVAFIASDKTLTVAGTLTLGGTQSWTTVGGDGTLKLDGGTLMTNTEKAGVTVSAAVEFGGNAVINTEKGNLTLSGEIVGSTATLTKKGSKTLTFEKSIGEFAGALIVEEGKIALRSGDTLENAKAITIASGAELVGNVEMSGGTFALESGKLSGSAVFTDSELTFGATVEAGAAKSSTITGDLSVTGSSLTLRGSVVSVADFTLGAGNTITLSEAFGKSISGRQTLIDFTSSNLASVNLKDESYITFNSGTKSFGRRRLILDYNTEKTSLDVVSTGTLIWNKEVKSWGASATDLWTYEDENDPAGVTSFQTNDYVMFQDAGSISLTEQTIRTSGVVFNLDGAFTLSASKNIGSATLADATTASASAGLSIYKGDVTFSAGVSNSMASGIYLYGGSLTVYSANALGSTGDSAAGIFLAGGTLKFVKDAEEKKHVTIRAGQKLTLGSAEAVTANTVDVANDVTVSFTNAFTKAETKYNANLIKTGAGDLELLRSSAIDLLQVSAGKVSLTGAGTLGVGSVYVAGTLNVYGNSWDGSSTEFGSVTLNSGKFNLDSENVAFRTGTLTGIGTVSGLLAVSSAGTTINVTGDLDTEKLKLTVSGISSYGTGTGTFTKTGAGTLIVSKNIDAAAVLSAGTIEVKAADPDGGNAVSGKLTASGSGLVFRNSSGSTLTLGGGVALSAGAGITFVNSSSSALTRIADGVSADGRANTTLTTGSFEIAGTSANFGSGSSSRLTISKGTNVTVSAGTFTAGVLSLNTRSTFKLDSSNTSATVTAITVDTANVGATIDLSAGKTLTVEGVNGVAVLGESGKLTVRGVAGDDLGAGKLVVNGHDGYVSTGGMDIVLSNATLAFDVGSGTSSVASISSITTANNTSGVVEKSGLGTLSIASEADTLAFDGTIKVSEGTLRIGSRMTKAEVEIASGATLTFFGTAATAVDGTVGTETYKAPLAKKLSGSGTLLIAGSLLTNRVKEYSEDGKTWTWKSGLEGFDGTIAADGDGIIYSGAALAEWETNGEEGTSRDVALSDGGTLVFGGIDEEKPNTLNHLSVNGEGNLGGNARTLKDGTVVVDTFTKVDAEKDSTLYLYGKGIIGGMDFGSGGSVTVESESEWTFAGTNTGLSQINVSDSSLIVAHAEALGDAAVDIEDGSLTFSGVSASAKFANNLNLRVLDGGDGTSSISATDGAKVALTGTFSGATTAKVNFSAKSSFDDEGELQGSSLTLSGSALNFASSFAVDAGSTISVAVDSARTLSAKSLSGAGMFEKTGAGTLSVSGDAGTIGTLAVSEGTVSFSANSKIAAASAGEKTLSVADGATLNLAAGTDLSGFTLSGDGAVEVSANSSNSAKLAGMSGATAVSLKEGTLQVGGNVSDSAVAFASGTALETTGEKSNVSGTTLTGTSLKLINSGTATYERSVTLSGTTDLTLQADGKKSGTFAAAYAGNLEKTGDGTWTVSNYSFGASDGQELTVSAGKLIWESANFGTAASKLTVEENAILQIASLASGNELNTTISGAGILQLANCGASDAPFAMNATAADDATWALYLSGTSYVEMKNALPGSLFISDTATGVLDVSSDTEMGTGKRVYVGSGATLSKTGTGTLTLSEIDSKHSFAGTLDIQAGTVVQAGAIVWDGGTLNIAEDATFEVNISSENSLGTNRATLTGEGTLNIANTADEEYTLGGKLSEFAGTVKVAEDAKAVLTRGTFKNASSTEINGTLRLAISVKDSDRQLNKLSGAGTLIIDAPDNDSTIAYAAHAWGSGNTFSGTVQVKSGALSLDAAALDTMSASSVTIGGNTAAKYSEKGTSSGILRGGFLHVKGGDDSSSEVDIADKVFGNSKYSFTSKGGLLLSGGTFGVNSDSGSAGLFVAADEAKLHLRNGANINGSVFVARGTELLVGETSTTSGDAGTASLQDAGTLATNSSISGDFTLNGTLTLYVTDDSLAAGTPLLGVGGSVVLDSDANTTTRAEIVLDLSGASVSLDSGTITILGGTLSGDASTLSNLVKVTDSTGTTWNVSRDANGHLVLRNANTEYHAPKGLSELYAVIKDTALGDHIQADLGKSTEHLVALSPVSFGALLEMQSGFASLENDLLRERLEQRRYERAIVGDSNVKFKPFVNVFGADREGDGNGTDSANYDMTHAGVFGGFDTAISSNTILGISVGLDWAKARLHDGAGKHTGDGSRLGVYGMSQFANAYVGYGLSAGGMSFETKRNTGYNNESVSGETDGNDVNASFLFGAGWTFGSGVDIAPFVGVDIGYARTKSFTEKDGNETVLDVEKTERWSVRGKIGAALNWRATENLRLGLEASFAHEFLDTEADIDAAFASGTAAGTKFTSTAYLMDENTIQIGPRVDCRIDETWSLSAAYTFETDLADTTTHSANFGLRARF